MAPDTHLACFCRIFLCCWYTVLFHWSIFLERLCKFSASFNPYKFTAHSVWGPEPCEHKAIKQFGKWRKTKISIRMMEDSFFTLNTFWHLEHLILSMKNKVTHFIRWQQTKLSSTETRHVWSHSSSQPTHAPNMWHQWDAIAGCDLRLLMAVNVWERYLKRQTFVMCLQSGGRRTTHRWRTGCLCQNWFFFGTS